LQVFPSEANFILLRTPVGRADEIFDRVKDLGVLIKNLHGSDPALADCLRVTVGSAAENKAFLNALATAL
jgi:histidinol-phosphate aminotransferase